MPYPRVEETTTTKPVFETLRDRHRCHILRRLAETEPEPGRERYDLDGILNMNGDSKRVRILLYHNHLPRLDDAGFIDWDRETGTIAQGPQFDEIEPVVRLLDDHRDGLLAE